MSRPPTPPEEPPSLHDPWDAHGRVPLDGALERSKFSPGLLAGIVALGAFAIFFITSNVAAVAFLFLDGADFQALQEDYLQGLSDHAGGLLLSNTVGQILGLALPAFAIAWLHSSRWADFLRFRRPDLRLVLLAVAAWIALYPAVNWLGQLNQGMPMPEWLQQWEAQQMALIEQVLMGDLSLGFSLAVMALTPAICEEVLFRGYFQRQVERGTGVAIGIILSGVVFAIFHLRLSQVLPLALLGIFLAYLAWRTGSLWIPVIIHFLNNAYAVSVGFWVRHQEDLALQDVEQLSVPWYLLIGGLIALVIVYIAIENRAQDLLEKKEASRTGSANPELPEEKR